MAKHDLKGLQGNKFHASDITIVVMYIGIIAIHVIAYIDRLSFTDQFEDVFDSLFFYGDSTFVYHLGENTQLYAILLALLISTALLLCIVNSVRQKKIHYIVLSVDLTLSFILLVVPFWAAYSLNSVGFVPFSSWSFAILYSWFNSQFFSLFLFTMFFLSAAFFCS